MENVYDVIFCPFSKILIEFSVFLERNFDHRNFGLVWINGSKAKVENVLNRRGYVGLRESKYNVRKSMLNNLHAKKVHCSSKIV